MATRGTSIQALKATDTATLRAVALRHLRRAGVNGLIDDEGGALMKCDRLTFGRRRVELVASGLAKDSGRRRHNKRGQECVVWVYVPPAQRSVAVPLSPAQQAEADLRLALSKLTKVDLIDALVAVRLGETGDDASPENAA